MSVVESMGSGTTEVLSVDEIMKIPEFAEIGEASWKKAFDFNDHAMVRRRFKPGEMICQEGEYVYTAYYVLKGKVEIFISAPIAHVKTDSDSKKAKGFFATMTQGFNVNSNLVNAKEHQREEERQRTIISIDASVDLNYDKPVAELGPGEIFGEMSCLSLYPRSASVRAIEECELFEMHRNVLESLKGKKNKPTQFGKMIEKNYKDRALASHLRSIKEFSSLPDGFIEHLKERVELVPYEPKEVICKQGDPADSLYLVRIGFVRVSQEYAGGDLVLGYTSRGEYFGEMGLLVGGTRSATCTAADHVEVVKINKEDFDVMIDKFPAVKQELAKVASARMKTAQAPVTPNTMEIRLDQFQQQGLLNAQNVLLIDLARCTRCDECVHACADAHESVTRLLRDGLRFENYLVTTSCRQCTDPVCMIGCPVGSIRRRESLEVIIEDWCIGCDRCAKNCPYGNITMHEFDVSRLNKVYEGQKQTEVADERGKTRAVIRKATNCDLCIGLEEPSCVYACPHEAAMRVGPEWFYRDTKRKKVRKAQVKPSSSAKVEPSEGRGRWKKAVSDKSKLKPWER